MKYCADTTGGKVVMEWCLYLHSGVDIDAITRTAETVRHIAADDIKELLNASSISHTALGSPIVKVVGGSGITVSVSVTAGGMTNLLSSLTQSGFIMMKTDRF